MNDTQILTLFELVTGALERNTEALREIKTVIAADADASVKMADQVKGLRATIQGAQRNIGNEIAPLIEKSKETLGKLEAEREEVRHARSQTTGRGSSDARP